MQKAMITTAAAGKESNSLWTVGCFWHVDVIAAW
jgi:hypothetical protein